MLTEEISIPRKQTWVQNLLDAGKIDLGVLGIRMIAMNEKGSDAQSQQANKSFDLQNEISPRDSEIEVLQSIPKACQGQESS